MTDDLQATIDTVREYEADIERTKRELATVSEQLKDELENTSEYAEVERLKEELAGATEKLRLALNSNGYYNDLLETKGQLNDKQRDQKEILSDHLVAYFALTKQRQIELDDNGRARDVMVSAKLGKEGQYQTSMFTAVEND